MNNEIWIHKYAPKDVNSIIGQNKAIETLTNFIKNYKKQKKKAILLYGSSGLGKTSSIYAIAGTDDYEIVEVNASDFRTKDEIESKIGSAINQMSLFMKPKIILIDEIDGLSGTKDRGGLAAVNNVIKKSTFPVIFTLNDPYDKKFSTLRRNCEMVEFRTLNYLSISNILQKILTNEGIEFEEDVVKSLARRAGGDARSAINDLQMILGGKKKLDKSDLDFLSQRDSTESVYNAILKVFKTTDFNLAASSYDNVSEDLNKILLFLDENLPVEYQKPKDLINAYEAISKSDVYSGRIRRQQYWRFLLYINILLSAGVALAKEEKYKKFIKYNAPTRILALWRAKQKYLKRESIAQKIAIVTHTSKKRAINSILPFVLKMCKKDKNLFNVFTKEFEFNSDEVSWIKKQLI
jgi:replication factor C large subunit